MQIRNKLARTFLEQRFGNQLDRFLRHSLSTEQAHGRTRADVVIENRDGTRAAVLEIKSGVVKACDLRKQGE